MNKQTWLWRLGWLSCVVTLACGGTNTRGRTAAERAFSPPTGSLRAEPVASGGSGLEFAKTAGRHPDAAEEWGQASWYGAELAGHKTANGERFDPNAMTAAHRTLPFGTWVEVRRSDTGRAVRVRINDRGPFARGRVLDLSRRAAQALDMLRAGVAPVELRRVAGPE
jgi:rare lipoprotein A (peptidoglycan hydrolase)